MNILDAELEDEREAARLRHRQRQPTNVESDWGWAQLLPLTVRCAWCDWSFTDKSLFAIARAGEHRRVEHGKPGPARRPPSSILASYRRIRAACCPFSPLSPAELDGHAELIAVVCAQSRGRKA